MGSTKKSEFIAKYGEAAWEKKLEQTRQWRKAHPDYHKKKNKEWKDGNPDKVKSYNDAYHDEHREQQKEYDLNRYWSNPEYHKQRRKEYYLNNKEKCIEYYHSAYGRAGRLIQNYKRNDKKYNRGPCTITPGWVLDHIFTSSCVYCGDSDWKHLGCDRIDNSLPHTPENCICACGICNIDRQLQGMSVEDFKKWRSENPRECDIKKVG